MADWLTLREASRRLDVHPATLRQWADRGRLRSFRTPGGHRRFSAEDVGALVAPAGPRPAPELELLQSAVLGRARRELAGGMAAEPWYRLLEPGARDRFRQLGRELLGLLTRWLVPGPGADAALAEARRAGDEQGRLALRCGMTTPEAVGAHARFRDMLIETMLQVRAVQDRGRPGHDPAGVYRRASAFLDVVLVAYLEAFTEGAG